MIDQPDFPHASTLSPSSAPRYYPVFLDLRGRLCVVAGGGRIARDKVLGLVEAGARVRVIAPRVEAMPEGVEIIQRPFDPAELAGAALAVAATDDPAVNQAVARAAGERGIPVNVVDDPEACTFLVPAVVRRGRVRVAISTGGASPLLARRLRERIEAIIGEEWGELAEILMELRRQWEPRARGAGLSFEARRQAWDRLLDSSVLEMLREGRGAEARQLAENILAEALKPYQA